MSVKTQIDRIGQNVANTYAVLSALGADMPAAQTSDNLAATAGTAKAVLYSEQTLTEDQQAQARSNIGIVGTGADGQRGTGVLRVTSGPTSYNTTTGGFTPSYRIELSKVKSQAKVDEVKIGDTLLYSYYHYPIGYVDDTYVYIGGRVSIRGTTGSAGKDGADGKTAYQYAQDGGYTGTEAEFADKLAKEYTTNPLHGKKVSFLGDSICAGDTATHLGGYGKIIADRNGMVYENVARGGATVTAETYSSSTGNAKPWLCRMVANMSADADYAIIEGGINDGWDETVKGKIGAITKGYDATLDDTTYYGAFESMLKQLITKFQGKKIGYIAVPKIHSLYDSSQNAPNFYHIALECCAKWGVSVCDLNTITPPVEYLRDLGDTYTADGTHPTYEGYLKYYCDPIEAWMQTLTTSGMSANGSSIEVHNNDTAAHSDIRALIASLQNGKLSNEGVSFKRAKLPLADGTILEIDVLTALNGTVVIPYINQMPISIDSDGSVYNGTGWKDDTRLSASSGSVKESTDYASITGFIPVKPGDTVRFKFTDSRADTWDTSTVNSGWNIMAYYNSSFIWLGSACPLQSASSYYGICGAADNVFSGTVADGGIVSFTVPSNSNIAYLRLSFAWEYYTPVQDLSSLIVTVNQEIT